MPRRLVPRRQATVVADTLKALRNTRHIVFIRRLVEFEDASGARRWILILDIRTCGRVDAAVSDGLPHYLAITLADLLKLRIVCAERMKADDVAMYRRMLKMNPPAAQGEARAERLEVAA